MIISTFLLMSVLSKSSTTPVTWYRMLSFHVISRPSTSSVPNHLLANRLVTTTLFRSFRQVCLSPCSSLKSNMEKKVESVSNTVAL